MTISHSHQINPQNQQQFQYQQITPYNNLDFLQQSVHNMLQHKECDLVGFSGIVVQILLAIIAFSVLLFKRKLEHPPRNYRIWFFDTFKQVISQLSTHAFEQQRRDHISKGLQDGPDQCNFYFVTIIIDTSIGVWCACLTVYLLEKYVISKYNLKQGNFYKESVISPYNQKQKTVILIIMKYWFQQLFIWLSIVFTVKVCMFSFQYKFEEQLGELSYYILYPLNPYPLQKLILVMMIIPTFMNMLLFWTQDNFLQKKKTGQNEGDKQQQQQIGDQIYTPNENQFIEQQDKKFSWEDSSVKYDVKKIFYSGSNQVNVTDIED